VVRASTRIHSPPSSKGRRGRLKSICSSLNQHLIQAEAPTSPFVIPSESRDLQFSQPASDQNRSADLPFVIPSEVEGSAVLLNQHLIQTEAPTSLCHPDRSRGICSSLNQQSDSNRSADLPLSSRAKSRDLQFFSDQHLDSKRSADLPLSSERSEGSAVLINQHLIQTESAMTSPLSSRRAKSRDLRSQPAS